MVLPVEDTEEGSRFSADCSHLQVLEVEIFIYHNLEFSVDEITVETVWRIEVVLDIISTVVALGWIVGVIEDISSLFSIFLGYFFFRPIFQHLIPFPAILDISFRSFICISFSTFYLEFGSAIICSTVDKFDKLEELRHCINFEYWIKSLVR